MQSHLYLYRHRKNYVAMRKCLYMKKGKAGFFKNAMKVADGTVESERGGEKHLRDSIA